MPENVKRVKWPVERVREERQQRLRSLIRVAKEKSPWHGERLGNVDADSITEADLGKLPVMTKADLMANFDQIITDKRLTLEMVNAHVSFSQDRKSTRLNSSHRTISYAVFCLKKKIEELLLTPSTEL